MNVQVKPRFRRSVKVSLVEFLRPSAAPYPYSLEIAFQALRCLVKSGVGYEKQHQWHRTSVSSLLGAQSADNAHPKPIVSVKDLLLRFHAAIFTSGYAEVERWRADKGIQAYAELDMDFLHYKPMAPVPHLGFDGESEVKKALVHLLEKSAGQRTGVSLNSVHHSAQVIHQVDITVSPSGFCFVLRYGFEPPGAMDSEWSYCLASTKKLSGTQSKMDEPFLDTLRRALDSYAFVMNPANAHLTTTLSDDKFVEKDSATMLN